MSHIRDERERGNISKDFFPTSLQETACIYFQECNATIKMVISPFPLVALRSCFSIQTVTTIKLKGEILMSVTPLTFNFLDAPMGAGKTTAIIHKLQTTQQRYLVVVPYLTEVERLCQNTACITPPAGKEGKQKELLKLVHTSHNICITSALFTQLTFETLTAFAGYALLIDEEPTLLTVLEYPQNYTQQDIGDLLAAGYCSIETDTKRLYANKGKKCVGVLAPLFAYICNLLATNDIYQHDNAYIVCKKREIWEQFTAITICSYRMQDSLVSAYCMLKNIAINYQHIQDNQIIEGYSDKKPANLHRLHLYTPSKLNCSCSVHWYQTHTEEVKKVLTSFNKWRERHVPSAYRKSYYWTTFKAYRDVITATTNKITPKKFVQCNAKATNDFMSCHVVGVFMQRFLNVPLKQFLLKQGISINEKEYALSEVLQFIWRSNIRTQDTTPIYVFIGSRGLYTRLVTWLNS